MDVTNQLQFDLDELRTNILKKKIEIVNRGNVIRSLKESDREAQKQIDFWEDRIKLLTALQTT